MNAFLILFATVPLMGVATVPSASANAPVSRRNFVIQLEQIAKVPQVQKQAVYHTQASLCVATPRLRL